MTQREAALVSLPEFRQRQKGWEREQRAKWEIARWMMWQEYLLNPYIKPAHKPKKPSDILPLEGDPIQKDMKAEECHISEEERITIEGIFNELKQRNNG